MIKYSDLKIGDVFESNNSGAYVIIKIINSRNIMIRFIATGYIKTIPVSVIRSGMIKDSFIPTVYGIGVKGDELPSSIDNKLVKEYATWKEMLRRIADEKSLNQFPTYRECSVCERWLYYPNFYHDIKTLPGYQDWIDSGKSRKYNLDKDIKIPGSKIYSPYTCMFVTASENSLDANRRRRNKN